MTSPLAGFTLPHLSEFDPPVAGEGSLDPMGVGTISEQLSNQLVPDLRARMARFRLLTAIAVGGVICDSVDAESSKDGVTTPQIAFEWIILEAFARSSNTSLRGVPGLLKARAVIGRRDRLSANSYLKGPAVFGFHGVYKPLAIALGIVTPNFGAGERQGELVRAWEQESSLTGFIDGTPGTDGGQLRDDLRLALRRTLDKGRCDVAPTGRAVHKLAQNLDPDGAGKLERQVLRTAFEGGPELRSELALLLIPTLDVGNLSESDVVADLIGSASPRLREVLDAVVAYEAFARTLDACFRTLCYLSNAIQPTPLKFDSLSSDQTFVDAANTLPAMHRRAVRALAPLEPTFKFDVRFADFAETHTPAALAEVVRSHHETIQKSKPPLGKRSWFEPYQDGWLVRPGYGVTVRPTLDGPFIHPIRVNALRRFLRDSGL